MLHNIIKVVDGHPKLTAKKLNLFRSTLSNPLDSYPTNIPTLYELKKSGVLKPGTSFVCLVKVKDLFAEDKYNRIDDLNLSKAMDNIESKGGFSYADAQSLHAYLRPNGTLICTQGAHRTAKRYLTQGPDAFVVVYVEVHENISVQKCEEIEAKNFTRDNVNRWNMIQKHKFKGAFVSADKDKVELYNFVKPFGISIAGTNVGDYTSTHTFESYGNLLEALSIDDTQDKKYVKTALQSLVNHLSEKDIQGFLFVGLVMFEKVFGQRVEKIIKNNNDKSSFDDFIRYIFKERRTFNGQGDLTTQKDIVEDSGGIKIREFFASRFVVLFNEYCFARKMDFKVNNLRGSCAIPESCDEWQKLIDNLSTVKRRLLSAERM
jgi:hypothetical protein